MFYQSMLLVKAKMSSIVSDVSAAGVHTSSYLCRCSILLTVGTKVCGCLERLFSLKLQDQLVIV